MKTLIKHLSIVTLAFMSLLTLNQFTKDTQSTSSAAPVTQSSQHYTYEITSISNGEVNGVALDNVSEDNQGIYLLTTDIPFTVQQGDVITVTYDQDDIQSIEPATQTEEPTQSIQSHTYTYTVTHSSNGEYYAASSDQAGLFFTESELTEPVKVGDTITATFEGNEVDSPFTVSLSDKEGTMIMAEDGSYVAESYYK